MEALTFDDVSFPTPLVRVDRTSALTGFVSRSALENLGATAKIHLDISCSGLERSVVYPPDAVTFELLEFRSLTDVARWKQGRPCRVCALEATLDTVLRPRAAKRFVTATFTSQPSPHENLRNYRWRSATESGAARLERIAARLGLPVVATACGPATWGRFPLAGVAALRRNLRTFDLGDCENVTSSQIQMLWALLSDDPPEVAVAPPNADPWEIAQLVCTH